MLPTAVWRSEALVGWNGASGQIFCGVLLSFLWTATTAPAPISSVRPVDIHPFHSKSLPQREIRQDVFSFSSALTHIQQLCLCSSSYFKCQHRKKKFNRLLLNFNGEKYIAWFQIFSSSNAFQRACILFQGMFHCFHYLFLKTKLIICEQCAYSYTMVSRDFSKSLYISRSTKENMKNIFPLYFKIYNL